MPSFTFNLVTANYVFSFENSVFCLIVVATIIKHIVRNHFRVPFDPFDTKLWRHSERSNYLYLYLLGVELPTDTYTIIQSYGSDTRCFCIKY